MKGTGNFLNEIGSLLKKTREDTGISIEEAGKDLDIKSVILDNIENGNIGCFKDIYLLKDYIKNYAKYLGLDDDKLINEFNEYMFEYTSKIPVKEIEEKMVEQQKLEETQEIKISSPYTEDNGKYKSKFYIFLTAVIIILIGLAIFWSIKQITIDNEVTTTISWVK